MGLTLLRNDLPVYNQDGLVIDGRPRGEIRDRGRSSVSMICPADRHMGQFVSRGSAACVDVENWIQAERDRNGVAVDCRINRGINIEFQPHSRVCHTVGIGIA